MSIYYDIAQICLNGHIINVNYKKYPEHNRDFCDKCGKKTITKCPHCEEEIRGEYEVPDVVVVGGGMTSPPNFCHNCGHQYPWTEMKLQAVRELADELDELTPQDRELLSQSLDDLIQEGPKTEVAGIRLKKILAKIGKDSYEVMKNIVTDIVSETIKKTIFSK